MTLKPSMTALAVTTDGPINSSNCVMLKRCLSSERNAQQHYEENMEHRCDNAGKDEEIFPATKAIEQHEQCDGDEGDDPQRDYIEQRQIPYEHHEGDEELCSSPSGHGAWHIFRCSSWNYIRGH